MKTQSNVLLLEFNEMSPPLMDKFIAAGELPNFKRLRGQSQTFITDAEEQDETLEPWIQWVTLHTGLAYEQHGIFNLGDAHKLKVQSIWDMLSRENFKVWICGSMNVKYERPINGLVLPDAWSNKSIPCAEELQAYCNFIRTQVQEHTNDSVKMHFSDYIKVIGFLVTHGLSFSTIRAIFTQLLDELGGKGAWKRAAILDKLQMDVFAHYFRKTRPHFSTLFSNTVAHFQHKYWRNMEPQLFDVKPSDEQQAEYANAILFAYKETDKLVGRALALAGPDTTIVFASALSQQPYLVAEEQGGKCFYRPHEFKDLLDYAGIQSVRDVVPVMSEEFHLYFDGEQQAEVALSKLAAIEVAGRPMMKVRIDGSDLFAGCQIFDDLDQSAVMSCCAKVEKPFFDIFYQADSLKSGMHHSDGLLWVRGASKQHLAHETKLPLRAVAPAILSHFGVKQAPGMSDLPVSIEF